MMASSFQATDSFTAIKLVPSVKSKGMPSEVIPNDDLCFLLYFVVGAYFGPDLKGGKPKKSVLMRIAEGFPSYTSDQLGGSHIKTVEVEQIYYYVLRKADPSVVAKLPVLHQFLEGNLPNPDLDSTLGYPQFPDLFPLKLHPHSQFRDQPKTIKNVVFIYNPEMIHIRPNDIERFKKLTGLEEFVLNLEEARLHEFIGGENLFNVAVQEDKSNSKLPSLDSSQNLRHTLDSEDHLLEEPVYSAPVTGMGPLPTELGNRPAWKGCPAMMFFPSKPSGKEIDDALSITQTGFFLTGSAVLGHVRPLVGRIDVGQCEDSYYFRVSLPGVERDENTFSCEVDTNGKVLIKGVTTTGEKIVHRYAQVFHMKTQNLGPPGQFSASFQLPGPVNPQQFIGNYGIDGILEGIVMKMK